MKFAVAQNAAIIEDNGSRIRYHLPWMSKTLQIRSQRAQLFSAAPGSFAAKENRASPFS